MQPQASPPLVNQPIDVAEFFMDITEAYLDLERSILQLLHTLPDFTPQEVLDECRKIVRRRAQLTGLDERMLAIIELAGEEIAKTNLLHDYRIAFAKALMASNTLYQRLSAVKVSLEQAPVFPAEPL